MNKQQWNQFLSQKIQSFIDHNNSNFKRFSKEQMDFRSAPDKWSANECLQHIIVFNELYIKQFKEIVAGTHKNPFFAPFSRNVGRTLVEAATPGSEPSKTYGLYEPSNYDLEDSSVAQAFNLHLQQLSQVISSLGNIHIRKIKLRSPSSSKLKFTLEDGLKLIVMHTERHMIQAMQQLEIHQKNYKKKKGPGRKSL